MHLPASKMQTGDTNVSAIPQMIILLFWNRKSSADIIYTFAYKLQKIKLLAKGITILVHKICQPNKQGQVL